MSDGVFDGVEGTFFDFMLIKYSVGQSEADPYGDFGSEPAGDRFGLTGAFTVDFDDVEFFVVLIKEGAQGCDDKKIEPIKFGASNAFKS